MVSKRDLHIFNYCICFIDLLGIADELSGHTVVPEFANEREKQTFEASVARSVGRIRNLQERANQLVEASRAYSETSIINKSIPEEQRDAWEQLSATNHIQQRWSDGLVYFSNLGDQQIKCPVNSVYELIVLAGAMHLQGLSIQQPLRGAIDISWATEIVPGEIYGAAVANAYMLESQVAQYPRIVVSERVVGYLESWVKADGVDVFTENNKSLAEKCLSYLVQDMDGQWIVHVLGDNFRADITTTTHSEIYRKSLAYIVSQLEKFRAESNTKLALRYSALYEYFKEHKP